MSWEGSTEVMREALERAGADWRWRDGNRVFRLGPDLPDDLEDPVDVQMLVAVTPVGVGRVSVADRAVYYVNGEPLPLAPLLAQYSVNRRSASVVEPNALIVPPTIERDLRCGYDWRCTQAEELWGIVMARREDAVDNVRELPEPSRWVEYDEAMAAYKAHTAACDLVGLTEGQNRIEWGRDE